MAQACGGRKVRPAGTRTPCREGELHVRSAPVRTARQVRHAGEVCHDWSSAM